jgi:2'-phosphotransferase
MGRQHVHFTFALGKTYTVKSGKAKDLDRQGGDGAEGSSTREGEEIVEEEVEERKVISGMRSSASVFVWVDVRRSIEEGGLKWWRSANGVVLTEGDERGFVRLKWIKRVVQEGKGVIWRGEEEEGRVEKGKEKSVRSQ